MEKAMTAEEFQTLLEKIISEMGEDQLDNKEITAARKTSPVRRTKTPSDPALLKQIKEEAKRKFKSQSTKSYAWVLQEYKSRGGAWGKKKKG